MNTGNAYCEAPIYSSYSHANFLSVVTEIAPRIVIDEAVRSGRPVIKGTRVPVDVVLGQLAAGLTLEMVAEEYDLERDDVLAALAYAAMTLGNEEVRAIG